MNELIQRTEIGEKLQMLKGCFIDHKETHSESYIDADLYRWSVGVLPPRRMASKTIHLVIYDPGRFSESGGHDLINQLRELGFDVNNEISNNERFALNPNTGVVVMYHHKIIINLTRPM